jgi:hypothetical protein
MVDCGDTERALARGDAEQPGVISHLSQCESCRALAEDGGRLSRALSTAEPPAQEPDAALLDEQLVVAVETRLAAERGIRGRLRSLRSWQRVTLVGLVGLVLVAFQPSRLSEIGVPRPATMAGMGVLMLCAVLALLRPIARPRSEALLGALATVALLVPFALAFGFLGSRAGFDGHWGGGGAAAACFAYGSVVALPFFVLLRSVDRWDWVPRSNAASMAPGSPAASCASTRCIAVSCA